VQRVSDAFSGTIVLQQIRNRETNPPQIAFEPCFADKELRPGPRVSECLARGCVAGSKLRWTQLVKRMQHTTMVVQRSSIRPMWWIDLVKSLNTRVERLGVYGLGRHGLGRAEP